MVMHIKVQMRNPNNIITFKDYIHAKLQITSLDSSTFNKIAQMHLNFYTPNI